MLLAIIDDGFFDWLFCIEFTLKKTQKQKTIFTSTKKMRSNWLHFFAKIKFISFYSANKRVKTTSLSPIKIFNSSVFFSFSACIILVQLVRKVSKLKWWLDIWICVLKQTRTLLRLWGICAALVRSLCGFGCGRCTAIVQSVCDFSAAFVQFWCTIIRSLCDFGATSPSVRIYHKKKCT